MSDNRDTNVVAAPVLRIARPTRNISRLERFYCDGLGLEILASFENHDEFDGVMFGIPGAPYHFEFTRHHASADVAPPDPDDLIVRYIPGRDAWDAAVQRMRSAGFTPGSSFNPFWDMAGHTFADPDGRRIVLYNGRWPFEKAT